MTRAGSARSATAQTQVTVAVAGQTQTVPVKVQLPAAEPPISFRHEVMPVLSAGRLQRRRLPRLLARQERLQALAARPGPGARLPRHHQGRRRPARQLPVPGDEPARRQAARRRARTKAASASAATACPTRSSSNWIRQGAPGDLADTAQRRRRAAGARQARAAARPEASAAADRRVQRRHDARRDPPGHLHRQQRPVTPTSMTRAWSSRGDAGETAIVGRFERTFAATSVIVLKPDAELRRRRRCRRTTSSTGTSIEKLNRLKITPSPLAGDEEFLRRVYLDLIGVQPKPDEVRAFLADKDPKKREKVDRRPVRAAGVRRSLVAQVGRPAAELAQQRQLAVGLSCSASSSAAPWRRTCRWTSSPAASSPPAAAPSTTRPASTSPSARTPTTRVERVTQVFCGVRMLCARCHTHPLENWTQADYYGLASFFNQVSARPDAPLSQRRRTRKLVQLNLAAGVADQPAHRPAAAAEVPRRRGADARRRRRPPRGLRRLADRRRRTRSSPAAWSTASGATSSTAASSSRWTTSAAPTRRSTRPCSTR